MPRSTSKPPTPYAAPAQVFPGIWLDEYNAKSRRKRFFGVSAEKVSALVPKKFLGSPRFRLAKLKRKFESKLVLLWLVSLERRK
jgi:hypothetical protein